MSIKNNTASLQQLLEAVNNLPDAGSGSGGVELPELTNPASADEIFLNKESIDENGKVKIGTFTIASELSQQDELLAELEEILNTKSAAGGEANPVLQIKTVSPTTSKQTITADSAYDGLKTVIVEAIPVDYVIPQGTLEITENRTYDVQTYEFVDVNVPIPSGYIKPSGTFEVTENGVHDITEYAAINVNVASSGGGTDTRFVDLTEGTLTSIDDDSITQVRNWAFGYVDGLKTVRLLGVTKMANSVFRDSPNLESVDLSNVTGTLGAYTFMGCSKLKTINVLNATNSSTSLCNGCAELERVEFGNMGTVGTTAFSGCTKLTTLIIRGGRSNGTMPPNLSSTNAFTNTPIANGTGYIYVKQSLLDAYKSATNWSSFANQIRAIEDYPEICG